MKYDVKTQRLINSILLFVQKYRANNSYVSLNGSLNPKLAKQLESIVRQSKKIGE